VLLNNNYPCMRFQNPKMNGYQLNHEVFTVKELDSGKENDGLWFSVPAAKFGDAVSIGRWLRYRSPGENVRQVRLLIFSKSLYPCGIQACII
jgi:hypothetical protein